MLDSHSINASEICCYSLSEAPAFKIASRGGGHPNRVRSSYLICGVVKNAVDGDVVIMRFIADAGRKEGMHTHRGGGQEDEGKWLLENAGISLL